MDLDSLTTTRLKEGEFASQIMDHPRSEKMGKVFVTPETKALLQYIGEKYNIGPSGVAALLLEELRREGQMEQVWKAHCNRRRRTLYRAKYGPTAGQ